MRPLLLASAAALAIGGAAHAEDDCIENAAGELVCGAEADAVRARISAEERLSSPAAPSMKAPGRENAQVSKPTYVNDGTEPDPAAESEPLEPQPMEERAPEARRGSVYGSYTEAAFVRGGYIFEGDAEAPSISTGYRKKFRQNGRSSFALEGELLYLRDTEDGTLLGVPFEATLWGLAGLGAVRWQYALGEHVSPFASVGIGPAYFRGKVESGGTTVSDGDFTAAYTGRAGLEISFSEKISLETAYRYLGTTQSGAPAFHSAELGLNYNF
jgi:opacity protein-like surface antigen